MSATAMKRNAGSGSNGSGSATAPSNGTNTKSAQAMGAYVSSSSTAAIAALRKDPAALLARGYTARYLGAVLQAYNNKNSNNNNSAARIPTITPLSNEEMDRDFRHICAYQEAATRYHQLTYAATNHINLISAAKNSSTNQELQQLDGNHLDPTTSAQQFFTTAALPVRIDPEEEKRRLTAQKRIQRAEAVREELEQHYVALRAHYVVTTQELQSLSQESERTIETLQQSVTSTATLLGYQRAKLQMTRDVAAAFQYRTNLILSGEYGTAAANESGVTAAGSSTVGTDEVSVSQGSEVNMEIAAASASDNQFPMLAAWNALDEECKRYFSNGTNGHKGNTAKSSKGKQAAAAAAAAATIVPWSCTMEPSTPYGIPLLLSTLATVPEKSIAIQTGNMFGSTNKDSLTWMESHLPSLIDDDGDDLAQTELDAIEALRKEVATLQDELLQERQLNQEILVKTGQSRIQHDEWVAMISLVRQETEAVLYRHNVLLESDEVRDAIATLALTASTSAEAVSSSTTMTMSHAHDDDDEEEEEEVDGDVEIDDEGLDEENVGDEGGVMNDPNGVGDITNDDGNKGSGVDKVSTATAMISTETTVMAAAAAATSVEEGGGASEADDEGIEEEEGEDVDDWDTTNNNNSNSNTTSGNKRSSATSSSTNAANDDSEESPGGTSRKRRKV